MKEQPGTSFALGAVIKSWRSRAGFTQQKFAGALKKMPGVVSAWEKGKSLPDLANMVAVAELLRTTPDQLLAEAGFIQARSLRPPGPPMTDPDRHRRLREFIRVLLKEPGFKEILLGHKWPAEDRKVIERVIEGAAGDEDG